MRTIAGKTAVSFAGTPRRFFGGAFCVLFVALCALPLARATAQAGGDIVFAPDVKIGMRTGVPLHARIYRPSGAALVPTVFSLEVDTTAARDRNARSLAAAGYAVIIATPRGGDDKHIGRDGYDVIEWVSEQQWSNRAVVMTGSGEGANAAWNAAREHPEHLASIIARAPARALGWTDTEVRRVLISTLSIAGSAGEEQGTAIETHERYVRIPHPGATPLAYLVIGTLDGSALALLERQWCDWAVGRGPMPPFLRRRVNYFVVNQDVWLGADSLGAIGAKPTSFPLHTDAGPRAAPGGFLGEAPRDEEPVDTVPDGGKSYETLLNSAMDIAGRPTVTLWLKRDLLPVLPSVAQGRRVSIEEVLADGSVALLGTSGGAPRVADSTAVKGGPDRWEFSGFPWIARKLSSGSKLRLRVEGAGIVIYHDIDRYSRVILPVVK